MQKTKKLLTIGITAIVFLWMLAMMPAPSSAGDITINGSDYLTIQAAINAASDGDIIEVGPDVYTENIDFKGKAITVKSTDPDPANTIIDGGGAGTVVTFQKGEDNLSVLDGFTIRRGTNGIYNDWFSSPTITNNIITGNGVGILNFLSSPTITNNIITGGDYGISNVMASPTITNNTITGNGVGIWNDSDSSSTITNNIITNNVVYGIYNYMSSPTIDYNDVWDNGENYNGCSAGPKDISEDPLFVDPGSWDGDGNWVQGDYHLQYDSSVLVSPIDAGDNNAPGIPLETDFDGNPRFVDDPSTTDTGQGTAPIVDMGAFEYQVSESNHSPVADAGGDYEASTSQVIADIDPDTLNINSKGKWVTAYLVADPDGTALVKLDGTGSSDPDEDELASYSWTVFDSDDNVIAEATGAAPEVELPAGEFEVELMVNDGQLDSESASTTTISVEILDVASVDPSQITLLGPNEDGSAISGVWGEMQEDAETLMVKFSRAALIPSLSAEKENSIEVGGGAVAGEDTIMVIEHGGGKGKNK
jgi:hypothetical protein